MSEYRETSKAIIRNNKILLMTMLASYIVIGMVEAFYAFSETGTFINKMLTVIIGLMIPGTLLIFAKTRDYLFFELFGLLPIATIYVALSMFSSSQFLFAYIVGVLFCTLLYFRNRLTVIASTTYGLSTLIGTIRLYLTHQASLLQTISVIGTVCIFLVSLILFNQALMAHTNEMTGQIAEQMEKIKANADSTAVVISEAGTKFDSAQSTISNASKSAAREKDSMSEISNSIVQTAESVQNQAVFISQIVNNVATVRDMASNASEKTNLALSAVSDGSAAVTNAKNKTALTRKTSEEVRKNVKEMNDNIHAIGEIVNNVLVISNKTKLLSLNASIESARAGEAGRGFAVVAGEIGELSTSTKNALERITELSKRLNENANIVDASTDEIFTQVASVTESAEDAGEKFEIIQNRIKELNLFVENINSGILSVSEAANAISIDIQNLSALSEEVAASSEQGVQNASELNEKMISLKSELFDIYNMIQSLRNS